ncbi:MAG: CBS domain-containing protein [Anaerolineae bacterium]|jgi:acetoin utilization protein AcuB|nr:CBS domain-containing protein [Anaerolineae bacterium]MBT7073210.1 CBS domain-containing protein [Anaerolineae bacterium]
MTTNPKWITTEEAAKRLSVSTARIRQMVAADQLTGKKVGNKYRGQWQILASDVEKRFYKKGAPYKMRVKNRMTPSPITATPETNYNEALRLMQQNHIKNLPIVNKRNELVGIVTRGDMLKAEPSLVTTLSAYEIVSLLEKVTMKKIMNSPVYAIDENCSITNAANFMLDNKITCLPIVQDGKLVGIITDTDIFKTFVEITGGGQAGTHIEARMPDQQGQLAPFVQAVTNAGSYIASIVITYEENGYGYVDVKERGGDEAVIQQELEKLASIDNINFRASGQDKLLTFK